jgi:CheY-like chemotaxis protein
VVRVKTGRLPLSWLTVAAGVVAAAAVYAVGFVYAGTLARPSDFTPTARLAVLAASVIVTLGVFLFVKQHQRDASAIRDTWLLAVALTALSWVALIRPALGDPDSAFTMFRIVFAALDVLLASLLVLLAIPQSDYRLRRVRVAGMVHLAANTVFAMTGLRDNFNFTSPLVITYLGFYIVLAGMGVRGRVHRLAHPEPDAGRPTRAAMRSARVAVLSSVPVASGVAVAIAVAAEPRASAMGIAAIAAVLMTLAVVRLRDLHTADSKLVDSLRDQCDELHERNALLAAESERALASLREASDFLADMTERVASPLNGVLESGDALREALASAPQIEPDVDKLVRSSDTLLFIVNDLLGISEASATPTPTVPACFDPRGLLTDVGETFVDRAAAKGVDLVVDADHAVPTDVSGQRAHVETLLRIFLDNAVKYSKQGEIELTATFIDKRLDGSVVIRFGVHDSGVGMSREHRQSLLSLPTEAETPPRRYRCKPHGLALVPALVELVGGDWGVESEVGRGSTFWFTATVEPVAAAASVAPDAPVVTTAPAPAPEPAVVAQVEPEPVVFEAPEPEPESVVFEASEPEPEPVVFEAPEPEPEPVVFEAPEPEPEPVVFEEAAVEPEPEPEPEPELELERMHGRLLLVEDNPLNRRVTLVALQNAGFRVEVATNGQEAVDALTAGAYDAVLMDCEMPVLDGFEATIRIRMHEADTRHTPIIALTVHATHDDQLRAAAAGMDDFLSKPFDTRTLLTKLLKWVPQDAPSHAN